MCCLCNRSQDECKAPRKVSTKNAALHDARGVSEQPPVALTVRRCRLVLHPLRLTEHRCALMLHHKLTRPPCLALFMKTRSPTTSRHVLESFSSCLCCITRGLRIPLLAEVPLSILLHCHSIPRQLAHLMGLKDQRRPPQRLTHRTRWARKAP